MEALNVELMVEHTKNASALQLEHKPIADDVKLAESVQQLRLSITSGLKDLSAAALTEAESHSDPLTLLRFLLARPGLAQATTMFLETMQWRATRGTTSLAAELHPSQWQSGSRRCEVCAAHFYGGFGGLQRSGHPFFVERLGRCDLAGFAGNAAVREVMADAYVAYMELTLRTVREATCGAGSLVRALLIIDAAGAGWSSLRHVGLLQSMSKVAVSYYPELYEPIVIVNAPSVVAAAWNLFAPFIPAETKRKISIVSSGGTRAVLEKHIAPERIPAFLVDPTNLQGEEKGGGAAPPADLPLLPRLRAPNASLGLERACDTRARRLRTDTQVGFAFGG